MEASNPKPSMSQRWQSLPAWGKWAIGIVGGIVVLLIGVVIGASGGKEEELKSELASTQAKLSNTTTKLEAEESAAEEAKAKAKKVYGERNKLLTEAEAEAKNIVGHAKSESESLAGKLSSQKGELEQVSGELSNAEESLSGAQEEKRLSTIPGNGTFKAEVDFLPGTYRSEGGPTCYWATLNSANPYDIASNENATGPTIADINTPYFQTQGCAKWERIGE